MKRNDILREYVRRLDDEVLKFLNARLSQRLGGDVGEAVEVMQRNVEIDKWLISAGNAAEFFDMVDQVDSYVQSEVKKRYLYEQKQEKEKATTADAAGKF